MATDDHDTEPDERDGGAVDEVNTRRSSRPSTQRGAGDRYRVTGQLGRGGMGEVVAARDEQLGREVAIKRMRERAPTEHEVARFSREARIQGRLDHPAIVPVHELGRDRDGLPFFAMKKVAGTTMRKLLADPVVPRRRLLRAFVDVCLAVEYAHVHGVIHRDLKPDNIVLGDYGDVYVLDWGVAKVVGESDEVADLRSDGIETLSGATIGTPGYMSPEQIDDSSSIDERSDVYALGCVLGNILARDGDPPPELVALCDRAVAPDRTERIASARELADRVQSYLDGDRDLDLRRRLAREHLAHARTAFEAGLADEDRRFAIRAASSAMALDPTLDGAAELVGRLMIEPPRTMPPEVEASIAKEEREFLRTQSTAALWALAIGVAFVVPVCVIGHAPRTAIACAVIGALAFVADLRAVRSAAPPPAWMFTLANAAVLALVTRVFSPFILAPPAAGLTAFMLAMNPFLERARAIALLAISFIAALIVPAILEQLGTISSTMEFVGGELRVHPAVALPDWMLMPSLVVLVIGVLAAALVVGRFVRAYTRAARRQLQLQTWQLRQLVTNPLAAA